MAERIGVWAFREFNCCKLCNSSNRKPQPALLLKVLKQRMLKLGNQLATNCNQLKLKFVIEYIYRFIEINKMIELEGVFVAKSMLIISLEYKKNFLFLNQQARQASRRSSNRWAF